MRANQRLLQRYSQNIQAGRLEWIGLCPERKAPVRVVAQVSAIAGRGLEGDRRCQGTVGSGRQVTIISAEHIELVARLMNVDAIDPARLRRNLVVSGINLNILRHQMFTIGGVLFEATAACHPCSRMEKELGPGGFASMYGYGGLCAKIISDGIITVGDLVNIQSPQADLFS